MTTTYLKSDLFGGIIINREDKGWKHLENFINNNGIDLTAEAWANLETLIEENEVLEYYTAYYLADDEWEYFHEAYQISFTVAVNNTNVEHDIGIGTKRNRPHFIYQTFNFEE